jgi:hypothetical protein
MSSLKTGFAPRPQVSTLSRPVENFSKPGGLQTRPGGGESVTKRNAPDSSGDRWLGPRQPPTESSNDRWLSHRPPGGGIERGHGHGHELPGSRPMPPHSSGDRWLGAPVADSFTPAAPTSSKPRGFPVF